MLLIPVSLLIGCGQMGALYLPKEDAVSVAKSTNTSSAAKTNTSTVEAADNTKVTKSADKTNKNKEVAQDTSTLASANDQTPAEGVQTEQNMQNTQKQ